jgi:4-hydroxy-tetrahydrodipicolinate synthase
MSKAEQQGLSGVVVPIVTPFTEAGEVDEQGLRRQVQRCIAAGVSTIFAGGSAGSGPLLSDDQWEQVVAVVEDETAGKCNSLVGIIATSTARALKQINISKRLGCKAIVVTPTFYIALQREVEILAHFQACREATDQELVIYNIPSCTGCHIPVTTIRKMAEAGWATAIKESSGDADYFRQLLSLGVEMAVSVLQGNETDIVWSLQAGAAGIVPVCGNYDPALFVETYNAVKSGTEEDDAQERLDALRDVLLVGDHNWIAGITYGLKSLGIGSGKPLLPLQEVDDNRKALIDGILSAR